jgi:hypothetical protein
MIKYLFVPECFDFFIHVNFAVHFISFICKFIILLLLLAFITFLLI